MVFFDAHVHLQKDMILENLLDCARCHFSRQHRVHEDETYCLLLAEAGDLNSFATLGNIPLRDWNLQPTEERESLRASRSDWPGGRLFILAGRQIITAERIEALALATPATIPDGLSLEETVAAAKRQGAIAVLPWGVGKWLGKRGKIVERFVVRAAPEGLFLGDNGGRPSIWPTPRLFATAAARGVRLLPGSDPLPLPGEESRVGSYGGGIAGEIGDAHPARDLKRLLIDPSRPIVPFGGQMGVGRFIRTQVALRRAASRKRQAFPEAG